MSAKLDHLLDRVKTWPAARQAEAELLLEAIEAQEPALSLSDYQAAEVRKRLDEPKLNFLSTTEARARLASRRA